MGCGCVVPDCKNRSGKDKKFHRFPPDLERKILWLSRIDRPNWTPNNSSYICEVMIKVMLMKDGQLLPQEHLHQLLQQSQQLI